MKTKIAIILALLMATICLAQQGINYKALLKDASGNALANTFMNVTFSIHSPTEMGTIVYQEEHNGIVTDANGILILAIGTDPSPSVGVFSAIDWAADLHFLQTTITYTGGTINFNATEFMAVPYAKHALTSTFATTSGDTKWVDGTTANDITNNNTGKVEIAGTLQIQATANINEFSVDGTLADNSNTAVPTERAVKNYVDSKSSMFTEETLNLVFGGSQTLADTSFVTVEATAVNSLTITINSGFIRAHVDVEGTITKFFMTSSTPPVVVAYGGGEGTSLKIKIFSSNGLKMLFFDGLKYTGNSIVGVLRVKE